jgi:glycosyltransferase involved in cell wall biosynthesis
MPRILFAVTTPMTANAFLKPQLNTLINKGWEVHIVCNDERGINELDGIIGLRIHPIPMSREPKILKDVLSFFEWLTLLSHLRPQIVIGSTPKAALLSMLSSKILRVPIRIYHVRGLRAEGFSGFSKKILLFAEKMTIKCSTQVICDSESLKKSLQTHGCLPEDSGTVIGKGSCCGVDTTFFRPPGKKERFDSRQILGISEDDFVVGFVGRVTTDKGINELLKAGVELNRKEKRIKIVIVGPIEKNFEIPQNNESMSTVTFVEQTQDVRRYYWAFDVFVLPSYREGFPIASLEAQSCGLPLITTNATGCIDSQAPTNSNLLIQIKDHKSIIVKVMCLWNDPKLRENSSKIAREWVMQNFDSKNVIENQNNFIFRQLL